MMCPQSQFRIQIMKYNKQRKWFPLEDVFLSLDGAIFSVLAQ